jgi:hypothetical protein
MKRTQVGLLFFFESFRDLQFGLPSHLVHKASGPHSNVGSRDLSQLIRLTLVSGFQENEKSAGAGMHGSLTLCLTLEVGLRVFAIRPHSFPHSRCGAQRLEERMNAEEFLRA